MMYKIEVDELEIIQEAISDKISYTQQLVDEDYAMNDGANTAITRAGEQDIKLLERVLERLL
jgi:hypothetical protein